MTPTDRQTLFRQAAIACYPAYLTFAESRSADYPLHKSPIELALWCAEQIVAALAEHERLHQHDGDPERDPDFQVAPAPDEIQRAVDALTATRVDLGRADSPVPVNHLCEENRELLQRIKYLEAEAMDTMLEAKRERMT